MIALNQEKFNHILDTHIRKYTQPNKIWVAYSGGIDSHVVLHLAIRFAYQRGIPIAAIHIHHGLSPNADAWRAHCEETCRILACVLVTKVVTVSRDSRKSLEAEARQTRYMAFQTLVSYEDWLFTGHHGDDQIESILLQWKRGSGPAGLAGMGAISQRFNMTIVRPLLGFSRMVLINYAKTHELVWVEDESNQDKVFERNFLRHEVLPKLIQRWPHLVETVQRSSELCQESEIALEHLCTPLLIQAMNEQDGLKVSILETYPSAVRHQLLRRWLSRFIAPLPSYKILHNIWKEVAKARVDANPQLSLQFGQVRRYQNVLYWVEPIKLPHQIDWPFEQTTLIIQGTGLFNKYMQNSQQNNVDGTQVYHIKALNDSQPWSIRFQANVSRLHLSNRSGSRTIKKLFQEIKIPPWKRSQIPMLYWGEQLILIVGIGIVEKFAWDNETSSRLTIIWQPK